MPSAADTVYARLRDAIAAGDYPAGAHLVTEQVAAALNVSRMPVREALRKLEHDGLIAVERHRGARVRELSVDQMDEVIEIRQHLEMIAVRRLVRRGPSRQCLARLEQACAAREQARTLAEQRDADLRFHRAILEGSGAELLNELCQRQMLLFASFSLTPRELLSQEPGRDQVIDVEHRRILAAIVDGDADRAATRMGEHLAAARESLRRRAEAARGKRLATRQVSATRRARKAAA